MQDQNLLGAVNPTIRTAENTADSPVPYNQNEAKKKIQSVIQHKFQLKVKVNEIKHNHLSLFFTHENGGKYYLKAEYHGHDNAITDYISKNMKSFSFLTN